MITRFLTLAGAAALLCGFAFAQSQAALSPEHQFASDIFKQLIEINTTDTPAGNVTTAAEAMAERFQVAKKVKGEESYREISKQTGSSTATITRVAHWLHHGMGGYSLVLKRLGH